MGDALPEARKDTGGEAGASSHQASCGQVTGGEENGSWQGAFSQRPNRAGFAPEQQLGAENSAGSLAGAVVCWVRDNGKGHVWLCQAGPRGKLRHGKQ